MSERGLTRFIHVNMEGERITRLPLNHPQRIKARDLKLQHRDEERAQRNEITRYRCPCNLCGGRRRPYKCSTVARHLRSRGRHGALRGWTEVMFVLTLPFSASDHEVGKHPFCYYFKHFYRASLLIAVVFESGR